MSTAIRFLQDRGMDNLGMAMAGALAFHALVILGISFDIHRDRPPPPERTLDITMVRPTPSETPEEPTKLAQHSQEGGAEAEGDSRAAAPPAKPTLRPKPTPAPEQRRATAPQPESTPAPEVLRTRVAEQTETVRPPTPPLQAPPKPDVTQLLASTQQEIDRLTAVIDAPSINRSRHERRKAINASTQEYLYANYLDAWRRKVEKFGNLNYPDQARRQRLFGHLLLHVAVRADGSVEAVRLVRSSGHKLLDDAAIRIVRLAAPFAPFPAEIREKVDVLDITRTWVFQRNNQLSSRR